jgi:hypothetical protein
MPEPYRMLPPMVAIVTTDQEMIDFKLRFFRYALASDLPQVVTQRLNIEFLITHYENGGALPKPGCSMWLKNGRVLSGPPQDSDFSALEPIWQETVRYLLLQVRCHIADLFILQGFPAKASDNRSAS